MDPDDLIRDALWTELPRYYLKSGISSYRQKIYEYIYTQYPDTA